MNPKEINENLKEVILTNQYIHTYISNWPLQPFSQAYGLASHTIHVVCVNFIGVWRDLLYNFFI